MKAMSTHYLDLTVRPSEDAPAHWLVSELYGKLHLALVRVRLDSVGVSFPGYCSKTPTLGKILRLHGSLPALTDLMADDWLKGLRSYVEQTPITAAPPAALHRTVYRKQFKTNVERLRRRRMKRKNETSEEVANAIPAEAIRLSSLPYVCLTSRSTRQHFSLFIGLGPEQRTPSPGTYSSYGLSNETTIPWF